MCRQIGSERHEIEIGIAHDRCHAGAALTARHLHAVDIGLLNPCKYANHLRNLGGRYVFALPAVGITDTVDKVEIAIAVTAHEIAGAEPGIAVDKYVAQDLRLIVGRVGVALESAGRLRRVLENPTDRLANLSRRSLLTVAKRI